MAQFEEIKRLIEAGQSDRAIGRALQCRRTLVARVRSGALTNAGLERARKQDNKMPPGWTLSVDWKAVEKDIRDQHQIKRIWEEVAAGLTSEPNFFKYVKSRFSALFGGTVTFRQFSPGEYCEVDWAGTKVEWHSPRTGEVHEGHVFVGIMCYSQKIFAKAFENERGPAWQTAHRRMFEFYGGVPRVVVPDNTKTATAKAHRYDPDLNPDYVDLAKHYGVAIVPARARHPKDKALVENAVGILMRYFWFVYRHRRFTSLEEINQALADAVARINAKIHTRFKVSRNERFESTEKGTLRALPIEPFSVGEWKPARVHPDCTVAVDSNYYTAPHIYRGQELRVKLSLTHVEIFRDLERVALHERLRGKFGERVWVPEHLPPNARAYLETTPQHVLSQARFIHAEMRSLIDELFQKDALANLRLAQGLVRKAFNTIQAHDREVAGPAIVNAIAHMRRFERVRVAFFEQLLKDEIKRKVVTREDRTIERKPGNPMVRGRGTRKPEATKDVPQQCGLGLGHMAAEGVS